MQKNKQIFRCKKCLYPNTKPDLHFNKAGVCGACIYNEYYKKINWEERKKVFFKLIDDSKKKRDSINYDCTIPVSGGKDSTYQTYLVVKELGLKTLLLSFEPSFPTEIGKKNLQNLVDTFGSDLILLKKSPTYAKLARICFDVVGDHEWPNHVGIYCWPIRMANNLNIPLTFYGEPRGLIGLGRYETFAENKIKRSDIEQYIGMNGYRLTDIIQHDKTISHQDVIPYIYPEKLNIDIASYDLGYFFPWEYKKNIEIIKKFGWKSLDTNVEGSFVNYEDLDCGFMPIHQYFKFIKYGYGRATDHACHEIRQGRLTLQQGKELIIEYDGKVPQKYFKEFLEFLNITEEHFFKTRDHFTNPILFKKDEAGHFLNGNDNNLFLTKLWFESFK